MFFKPAPPRPWPAPPARPAQIPVEESRGSYHPATAMREPARQLRAPDVAATAMPVAPPLATLVLNRAAFGPTPDQAAEFAALGADDDARLVAWVDQQLAPQSIADADCDARLASSGYVTLGKSLAQSWNDHFVPADLPWEVRQQPATESELATWTRAVYSRRQLFESMVHFWHNHFSLYAYDFVEGTTFGDYDRSAIRAHALGNFRAMAEAVARSPAMLTFLDNAVNFAEDGAGYSNENYSRELLELHLLGAESSYGKVGRAEVPVDGDGTPVGYCEADVQDLARALTGWTFDLDWISWAWGGGNSGQFVFVDSLHSTEAKTLLGTTMPAGRGAQQDGQQALDLLCSHPACGRFLARKLLRRFVCDFPDQTCPTLLASTAALFTSLWQDPAQIREVMRHILLSVEFRSVWGEKIKRPFEIAVSAMRAGAIDFRFYQQVPYPEDWTSWHPDFDDTATLHWMFEGAGQELFGWHPPNGHPDVRAAWQAANPRVTLWKVVNWLVEVQDGNDGWRLDALAQTPAAARTAEELVDFWLPRLLQREVDPVQRTEFVEFMAQGFNPTFDLPLDSNDWPYYWQDRVRALVGLIFMSPGFLWR